MLLTRFIQILFSQNTCTLSFYKKYGKKSAESYVSLKGNDKAISILQNVINKKLKIHQSSKITHIVEKHIGK